MCMCCATLSNLNVTNSRGNLQPLSFPRKFFSPCERDIHRTTSPTSIRPGFSDRCIELRSPTLIIAPVLVDY